MNVASIYIKDIVELYLQEGFQGTLREAINVGTKQNQLKKRILIATAL